MSCEDKYASINAVPVVMKVAAAGAISMIMTMAQVPVLGVLTALRSYKSTSSLVLCTSVDPNAKFRSGLVTS